MASIYDIKPRFMAELEEKMAGLVAEGHFPLWD